jgi:hypothetical protein
MLLKVALVKLAPETRAFTLVGAFMGYFALLEEGIGTALGEVLGIKGARRAIVTRNMSFDEKIKTLRTLVNFYIVDKTLAKAFDEVADSEASRPHIPKSFRPPIPRISRPLIPR